MTRAFLVHGIWCFVAIGTFVVGSQFSFSGDGGDKAGIDKNRRPDLGSRNRGKDQLGTGKGKLKAGIASPDGTGLSGSTSGLVFLEKSALSNGDILDLGRQFMKGRNPIERRLAFTRLLEGLTAENAKLVREQIATLPADSPEFREFHYAWGAIGGSDAVVNGADTPKRDMAATLAGWASADPNAAREWFENLPKDGRYDLNDLKYGVVSGLADGDPNAAARFIFDRAAAGDDSGQRMLGIVTSAVLRSSTPAEASTWSEGLPEGPLRASAMDSIANRYVASDPQAAAAWAERFNGDPHSARVIEEVGDEWAERDPASAVNWLTSLDNSEGQTQGLHSAFGEWARRDANAAAQYLDVMPESGARDSAVSGFTRRLAYQDPQSAIAWAETIGNAEVRQQSLIRVGQAYVRTDRDAAQQWLANSNLPPAAREQVLNPPRRGR